MKKQYKSPTIYVESFQLTQHLAGDCGGGSSSGNHFGKPKHGNKNSCGWKVSGFSKTVFVNRGCDIKLSTGNQEFQGICYNTPQSGYSIFTS
ncbi:MAG: hypothetical protein Q4B70_11535 [Lachnospiraceae bacterium]|nr:hypothetical protein [Lachnospiraceae bacterium]